ncbi:hypothetical protein BG006_004082, partial [Podila minutissima]
TIIIGTMPATSQKFKFGSTERELDLILPKAPHEPLFIYVDDVLRAFKIPAVDSFEADGRTISCMRDDKGTLYVAAPGIENIIVNKLDGLHDQGHVTQQIVRQVLEETQQIKNRLILIQNKTEAILKQQLELAEYPIPRLFIVLPEELA